MEWLAPVVAAVLLFASTITGVILTYRGNRSGQRENRAPDVDTSWAKADHAIDVAWRALDLVWRLRSAFRSYWMRASTGGSTELTTTEKEALEAEPPALDFDKPKNPA